MILDKRLSEWAKQHGLRAKGQTGFRKDYCTSDQLFILRTLIKQNKTKKKPLYYYFMDFKKVLLWHVKCYGRCWLASGWKDASCDAWR
jgi:hypothetical protein